MRTKEEIESRIKQYDYMASSHFSQITRAIAHEKADALRWVLGEENDE